MRPVFLVLLLACCMPAFAQQPDLGTVRSLYRKAPSNEKSCKELLRLLEKTNEPASALFTGYKGCATMIMARHVLNPFSKLSYFNKGKKLLEKAIKASSEDIELRLLRYTVQKNAPGFLGYTDDLEADRKFLQQHLSKVNDQYLKALISNVLTE